MPRVFITSGTSYTLPADFNPRNNTVECYGGGGAGATSGSIGSSGGGGGAYASVSNINIGAGVSVQIHIGSSGATDTFFNATSLANAVSNGTTISCGAQGASGQTGGSAASSCGTTKYSGGQGNGNSSASNGGGGGGGAAGPNGNGAAGGASTSNYGAGGGGCNGGAPGWDSAAGAGGDGGNGRSGTGHGVAPGGTATTNLGGGGAGGGSTNGGYGALDNIYSSSSYGPGGGGGGGSWGYPGGTSVGFGAGGGGAGTGSAGGIQTDGLIVITYVSAPVGGPSGGGLTADSQILNLRAPFFADMRAMRPPDAPQIKMEWLRQPADLLQRPPSRILYQSIPTRPKEAPNPTPLYKPPWLQWPELLRHPVAGLDYRQQFPGKAPRDFFARLFEGPNTVSTAITTSSPINADLYEFDEVTAIVHPVPDLGGSDDIVRRINLLLPKGWWNSVAPIRDAIIGGIADVAAWSYFLVTYAKKQSRVAWATDLWLDIISKDYFRFELPRRINEPDAAFRSRIQEELIRERVTRAGMIKALQDLTGNQPIVFEPWNTGDTGAWDVGTFAWDIAGGWGDTILPAQSFVNVIPPGAGIAGAPGWDIASGWDTGGTMWGDMSLISGTVTDADIYAAINRTRPTGSIVWTQLSAPQGPIPIPPAPTLTPSFAPPGMIPIVVQPGPQRYNIPVMPDCV